MRRRKQIIQRLKIARDKLKTGTTSLMDAKILNIFAKILQINIQLSRMSRKDKMTFDKLFYCSNMEKRKPREKLNKQVKNIKKKNLLEELLDKELLQKLKKQ